MIVFSRMGNLIASHTCPPHKRPYGVGSSATDAHKSPGAQSGHGPWWMCSNLTSLTSVHVHHPLRPADCSLQDTSRVADQQANSQSVITVIFNMCFNSIWDQFQALQIMYYYNRRKVFFKMKQAFCYHFQLSFDNVNWFFFFKEKELQQLGLWKSPSNRSGSYFPGCVVQHERLPGFSQDFPPQGTSCGSFLSEKKGIHWLSLS